MHSFEKTIHGRFSSGESAISAVVEHLWRFVSNGFFSADTQRKVRDYPYFETKKTVKKISRLKRGVYRAIGIGRQSRPLGQNKGFFFLQIRGRSRRRNYARESASICARKPAHGAGQAQRPALPLPLKGSWKGFGRLSKFAPHKQRRDFFGGQKK